MTTEKKNLDDKRAASSGVDSEQPKVPRMGLRNAGTGTSGTKGGRALIDAPLEQLAEGDKVVAKSSSAAMEKRQVSAVKNAPRQVAADERARLKSNNVDGMCSGRGRRGTEVGLEKPESVATFRASSKPGAVALSAPPKEKRLEMFPDQGPENESISKDRPTTDPVPPTQFRRGSHLMRPGAFAIDGSRSSQLGQEYYESSQQLQVEPHPPDEVPIVAHLVSDEETPHQFPDDRDGIVVAVAKKDSLMKLLRHDRRTQVIVVLVVCALIALGVGLGVSQVRSSSFDDDPGYSFDNDKAYNQTGSNIDGPNELFELGSGVGSKFGSSVSIAGNGTRIVIGAPSFTVTDDIPSVGLVQVFEEVDSDWELMEPSILGESSGGRTGSSVAMSLDASTIVVGSPGHSSGKGQVIMYRLASGTWQQQGQALVGEMEGDKLGTSVSISDDGLRVAVGIPGTNGNDKARVFEFNDTDWVQLGIDLENPFGGRSVSMSADGMTVAMGSLSNAENNFLGTVRVYEYVSDNWSLRGSDILLQGTSGSYDTGWSTSLSKDGNTLAIGSSVENRQQADEEYDLFVETYNFEAGDWTLLGKRLHDKRGTHLIAYAVSLSASGDVLAIGDPGGFARGINSGHTHVLRWQNGEWFHISRELEGTDAADKFGMAVSVSADGSRVGVGAPNSRAIGVEVGRVQIYELIDI